MTYSHMSLMTALLLLSAVANAGLRAATMNSITTSFYPSPTNCVMVPGYTDPALCTPPDGFPFGSFALPPVGQTYTDPTFGSTIRVISGQNAVHGYSTPSGLSASGRFAAISQNTIQTNIVDTWTGMIVYQRRPGSITADTLRWDALDDNIYYYFSGTKVFRHRLLENQTDVIADYSTDLTNRFTLIKGGGTGDTSKDNWLGFWAPTEHAVCAINLVTATTYCADYWAQTVVSRVGVDSVDYVLVTKGVDTLSHKRYVLLMASPALAVFSVDEGARRLTFEYRGGEHPADMQGGTKGNGDGICDPNERCMSSPHADTFEAEDGQQYLLATSDLEYPCVRAVTTFRLNAGARYMLDTIAGGGRNTGLVLNRCGGGVQENWVSNHIGCAKAVPRCVISTHGPQRSVSDLSTPPVYTTHLGEILVMRGNATEFQRLALNRSILWKDDSATMYWAEPRASISSDGREVLWDSNYGRPQGGTYVVVGYTDTRTPTPQGPVLDQVAAPALDKIVLGSGTLASGHTLSGNTVVLTGVSSSPVSCSLSTSSGLLSVSPGSLIIPAGVSSAQFVLSAGTVGVNIPVSVTAICLQAIRTASLSLLSQGPSAYSISLAKEVQTGGVTSEYNSIGLTDVAPPGGIICELNSASPIVSVPATVTVPAGSTNTRFTIWTTPVSVATAVTVSATCGQATNRVSVVQQVVPPSLYSITLAKGVQTGGVRSDFNSIALTGTAPSGGIICELTSASPIVSVPASVAVPAGSSKTWFSISTTPVSVATAVTVSATCGQTTNRISVVQQVAPVLDQVAAPALDKIVLGSGTLASGHTLSGNTVVLTGVSSSPVSCSLSTSSGLLSVSPGSLIIPAGVSSAQFVLSAGTVGGNIPVSVTAVCLQAIRTASIVLLSQGPSAYSISLAKGVQTGGVTSEYNSIGLTGVAPPGGIICALNSASPIVSVPATVTVPAGSTNTRFTIWTTPVSVVTGVTVSATCGQATNRVSVVQQVVPPSLYSISLAKGVQTGGVTSEYNSIGLTGVAPPGGIMCALNSSSPIVSVPAAVTVPAGSTNTRFTIWTAPVSVVTGVTVSATCGQATNRVSVVQQVVPPSLYSISLAKGVQTGGVTSEYNSIGLTGVAPPGGIICELNSASPIVSVPATVTVPAGSTNTRFTVWTTPVSVVTGVTVSAACGNSNRVSVVQQVIPGSLP